ncbi:ArsR/SmtB family transcription factor [Marinibacterium sp. SX1]|uniref:ArsR/SmtB family transcription factor n=1 Tax=Marinibacterium sp. SX1 TaxID=3388424 RepID=UPI003D171F23
MKDGPDISRLAALIGDPARGNMLSALMAGHALTATELAAEAGVSPQTASSHLKKLTEGGLVGLRAQGRHRYYALASDEVARTLEALMGLAASQGRALRSRPGPRDPALREARVCYNHLAGARGVQMFSAMRAMGHFVVGPDTIDLSAAGATFLQNLGLDPAGLPPGRAPLCRECLDWSMRQSHLAGRLGRAMLGHFETRNWLYRVEGSRAVVLTPEGQRQFDRLFARQPATG